MKNDPRTFKPGVVASRRRSALEVRGHLERLILLACYTTVLLWTVKPYLMYTSDSLSQLIHSLGVECASPLFCSSCPCSVSPQRYREHRTDSLLTGSIWCPKLRRHSLIGSRLWPPPLRASNRSSDTTCNGKRTTAASPRTTTA